MSTCLLISTHNRSPLLALSLARLAVRTQPDEILVVDDGGDDGCDNTCAEAPMPVRYIYTNNPGQSICSHARNVGIKNTDCDMIITSEPEMLFDSDVVAQMLELREKNPYDVISAGTINHQQADDSVKTLVGWVAPFVALYEKAQLMRVGGWDEGFPSPWGWDDTDLLTRMREVGCGQVIAREIVATHQYHPSRAVDQTANEARFRAKKFPHDHVANQGVPWGIIKPS